jgi:UrcA family protein
MNATQNVLPPALMVTACAAATIVLAGFCRAPSLGLPAPAMITVSSANLDFERPQDAQTMFDRIKEASIQVCGGTPDYRDVHRIAAFEQCRTTAIKQAVAKVGQPMLTAVAASQTVVGMRIAAR